MSLLEAAQRVFLTLRDMREKPPNLARAKIARMTLAVKQNVAPRPIAVALARLWPPEPGQGGFTRSCGATLDNALCR